MRFLVAFAALLVACTTSYGSRVPVADAPGLEGAAVSEVLVSVDEESLALDRLEAFRAHGGMARIRDAVTIRLTESGLIDPTSRAALHVRVVGFRLRSTSTSVWVGSMAGEDSLSVEALVQVDQHPVRRYTASASSLRGGLLFPGAGPRLNNLADHVAKELAAEMAGDG